MAVPPYAQPYLALPDAFSSEELDAIERIGDQLTAAKATLADESPVDQYGAVRITETAWIKPTDETRWLYAKMGEVVRAFNQRFFQFELIGFSEPFQYTIYRAAEGSHFNWHVDHGPDTNSPRKLSMSIQLTDHAKYEGCDLEMQVGKDTCSAVRARGAAIVFPSYVLHRVTPITAGERKALVAWATGPKFK